jgi:hypothetical protein
MSNPNEHSERPPTIAEHFRAIESVMEFYAESVASLKAILWEFDDQISDTLHNRLAEHVEKLEDSLWTFDKGMVSLRQNFYIDAARTLPTERIDYVLPSVDEELK